MSNDPGAGLWRRARAAWAEHEDPGDELDLLPLAAYIDGTLDANERERLEARLGCSAATLDLLVASRAALAEPAGAAPDGVIHRAQALVRNPNPRRVAALQGRWWTTRWVETFRPVVWSGVAAALALAAVSGFELGRVGVERLAALDQTMTEDVRLVMGSPRDEIL